MVLGFTGFMSSPRSVAPFRNVGGTFARIAQFPVIGSLFESDVADVNKVVVSSKVRDGVKTYH